MCEDIAHDLSSWYYESSKFSGTYKKDELVKSITREVINYEQQ
jgi:hypothetical protein